MTGYWRTSRGCCGRRGSSSATCTPATCRSPGIWAQTRRWWRTAAGGRGLPHRGVREVITDPHTTTMLRTAYPSLVDGFDVRVRSCLEVLAGRGLPAAASSPALPAEVVSHDSCVYARAKNVIEAPRQLLAAAARTVREPAGSGKQTWCCGGPAEALFRARATAVAASRVAQLRAVAPDCVTMCPICLVNLRKAAPDGSLRVRDISSYLAGTAGARQLPVTPAASAAAGAAGSGPAGGLQSG